MQHFPVRIDRSSRIPIYFQLQEGIVGLIESGNLEPGALIPSENELARHYNISPMTVRQAMSELVNQGYVDRHRGRGTYVSSRRLQHRLEHLVSFSEDIRKRNMIPGARLVCLEECMPPPAVLQAGITAVEKMTRIKRVRLADGSLVGIHDSFVNVSISRYELDHEQSLYALLESKGIELATGVETIEAVAASEDAAELLEIMAGSPLLRATRLTWDRLGRFTEYVVALYHPDLYRYTIQLKR